MSVNLQLVYNLQRLVKICLHVDKINDITHRKVLSELLIGSNKFALVYLEHKTSKHTLLISQTV